MKLEILSVIKLVFQFNQYLIHVTKDILIYFTGKIGLKAEGRICNAFTSVVLRERPICYTYGSDLYLCCWVKCPTDCFLSQLKIGERYVYW